MSIDPLKRGLQSFEVSRGNAATRSTSNSSVTTDISIGTTFSSRTIQESHLSQSSSREAYEAALKVVLLGYKNEPRFKRSAMPTPRSVSPSPSQRESKRHSFFSPHAQASESAALPKETIPRLKAIMVEIAMGKNEQITDPLSKRCFLHLYNDLLKPGPEIEKVEELVMMFMSSSTKEIKLYAEAHDTSTDVFKESDVFIQLLLGILRGCRAPERCITRLQEYRKSLQPSQLSSSGDTLQVPVLTSSVAAQFKPSYRLTEISAAKFIGLIFSVDELQLQQDIIRLKDVSSEITLLGDLELLKKRLADDEAHFTPVSFDRVEDYEAWKQEEQNLLQKLINKTKSGVKATAVPASRAFRLIPNDPRDAIKHLITAILSYETFNSESIISNSAKNIVDECCKYWRINSVSEAAILYQAAHHTIQRPPENEIDPEGIETLFGILHSLLQGSLHPHSWPKVDKKTWITNLSNTYIWIMSSLRTNLTGIFATKAPKMTPYLRILHEYLEIDPLFSIILKSGLPHKWLKRLRNTILQTTEKKYIEYLGAIPKDSSLDLVHIRQTSKKIYHVIQSLQKKFPRPLLDEIYIANEAGHLFIKLYAEDLKNMLLHIEHYKIKIGSKPIDPVDAIETYHELRDLRDIYDQVRPSNSKFPFNLENYFFKYMCRLADYSSQRIFPMVKTAMDQDDFEPLDLEAGRGYSISVVDIFKMINEIFAMFKNFKWDDEKQMAIIYTKLLKAVSDAIVYYAARIQVIIFDDLREDQPASPSSTDLRKKNIWSFDEMKAAVSGISKLEPPGPFEFKTRTCVALNNLSMMKKQLSELENQIDPERIRDLASNLMPVGNTASKNVFTVRVVKAENIKPCGSDGLSSTYVVLVDPEQRREIGKTRVIPKTLNPTYDEEFEVEIAEASSRPLAVMVWNHKSELVSKLTSPELVGRTIIQLDPRKYRNDGIPEEIVKDLDVQGQLVFQISLESEKGDALFSMGKAYRSITRTIERTNASLVDKFSIFINHSFSRQTLRLVCGTNGSRRPSVEETKDAIVPLFDYLNSNLQILAATLDPDILLDVMIHTWKVVLQSADTLILPALASVKVWSLLLTNSNWKGQLNNVVANVTNSVAIPGYGRALTSIEVDSVFIWLSSLSDFFHNDGAGPSLDQLRDGDFQKLLLVNKYYDDSVEELKSEVTRLTPLVLKALKAKNFLGDEDLNDNQQDDQIRKRSNTIARSKTILAYGSSKRRAEIKEAVKESDEYLGTFQIHTEDIILRTLLSKGEKDFVSKRLSEREKLAKSFATERRARLAVLGGRN